ncbi:hypothetical protein HY480_04915 [Candidatus Uhrbacteria bacterium]|nr:hypothetical protein [Candidatus Uhrbacteria bacterium]
MRMTRFGKGALLFGVGAALASRLSDETKQQLGAGARGVARDLRKTVRDGVARVKAIFDDPAPPNGQPPAAPPNA